MSAIFNILVQARIEQFDKINPVGAGNTNIKPGQIIIDRLTPKPVGVNGEVMLGSANWKPSAGSVFYLGQRFKMNLDVLYNKHSVGDSAIPVTELPKQLISISDPRIAHTTAQNKLVTVYNVKWSVVKKQFRCVAPDNAWRYMLFANAKSLGEASDILTNSAEDSLLAYYEQEAQVGDTLMDTITDAEAEMYDGINDCHDADNQNGAGDCHDAQE